MPTSPFQPLSPGGPPRLIIETDLFADVDDVGAIALAVALERSGHVTLAAVSVNTPSRFGPRAAAALLTALGSRAPVGRFPQEDDSVWKDDYARVLAERFEPGDIAVAPSVAV